MTWIQTRDGTAFDLLEPKAADVHFSEVAHALACIPRFCGHVPGGHYSVAQHCVLGADYLNGRNGPQAALCFLLHDAHEAYMGDIISPVIRALGRRAQLAIDNLKRRLDAVIYEAVFGLPAEDIYGKWAADVRDIDMRMLATEREYLLAPAPQPWSGDDKPHKPLALGYHLQPWSIAYAEKSYLDKFFIFCNGAIA